MITILQTIIPVIVALIGSYFGYKQFLLKRADEKEEKEIEQLINSAIIKIKEELRQEIEKKVTKVFNDCGAKGDQAIKDAILQARKEAHDELEQGLEMRGLEGKERFEINSKQIEQNTNMIQEVLTIQKQTNEKFDKLADSLIGLNDAMTVNSKLTRACAEGVRSTNYDRILLVANKALKRGAITISEMTNLEQLYRSWIELQGKDPKIETYYNECRKLHSIPDEEDTH